MIKDEKDEKPATDQQMIQSTIRKDQRINESTDQADQQMEVNTLTDKMKKENFHVC